MSKKAELPVANATAIVNNILNDQSYRGPDFKHVETIETSNNYLILGHNRLGIVDLQPRSNQPMWDETKRFCIAYNGMLYNYLEIRDQLKLVGYSFFSDGDTEVVLKAFMHWGVEAFNYFNGMFAIAIFDTVTEKLYLARDRFGIKPLFYCQHENNIYFSSTSNELANTLRLQPNYSVLARGITYWCYDSEDESIYDNLKMVAPSEVLVIHYKNNLEIISKKYYDLHDRVSSLIAEQASQPLTDTIERTAFLLEDAVKIRLRSNVPLAISLSGGIDSSTIASLAKTKLENLSAFSFGSLQNKYSEARRAKKAAEHAGVDLHFVYPTQGEMCEGFWQTLKLQDAPFPNLSIVAQYFVFNEAHRKGFKVMLGGQGGDEIFMGYRKYLLFLLQKLLSEKDYFSAFVLLKDLLPQMLGELRNFGPNLFNAKRYLNKSSNNPWQHLTPNIELKASKNEPLWKRQLQDISSLSLPTLLRYEDRNSMGNSIESRLPFLDYRLVELALSLPETIKLRHGYSKWILRKISQNYIPNEISSCRMKRGFDVETSRWITDGIGESLRNQLKNHPMMLKKLAIQNINERFSDQRLSSQPVILSEAITLSWLTQKKYFNWS